MFSAAAATRRVRPPPPEGEMFIFTIDLPEAEGFSLKMPVGLTGNFAVDWGDGTLDPTNTTSGWHFYSAGVYTVKVWGDFPGVKFNEDPIAPTRVTSVVNLGHTGFRKLSWAMNDCYNLASFTVGDADTSSLSEVVSMLSSVGGAVPGGCVVDLTGFILPAGITTVQSFCAGSEIASINLHAMPTGSVSIFTDMFATMQGDATHIDISSLGVGWAEEAGGIGGVFENTTWSTEMYSKALISFAGKTPNAMSPNQVFPGIGQTVQYDGTAAAARAELIGAGWVIEDGGQVP